MKHSSNPTIAITGANGFVGQALVHHFSSLGWQVVALVREPDRHTPEEQVIFKRYSLESPLTPKLLEGVDYLVHAAYVKQDAKHPEAFEINLEAAKRLMAAARKAAVKKSVFMSSMSAHEEAVSAYGRQKLAIEAVFSGKETAIIRSGLIIGQGGIVKQMADFMRSKHAVPLIGGGKQPLQIVAISDLVRVIERIITGNFSDVFTIATPTVYSYRQFYQALSRHLRVKVLFVPLPFWALLGAISAINALHLPLAVNKDNALGLKMLRSMETAADLKKLDITLLPLEAALEKSGY